MGIHLCQVKFHFVLSNLEQFISFAFAGARRRRLKLFNCEKYRLPFSEIQQKNANFDDRQRLNKHLHTNRILRTKRSIHLRMIWKFPEGILATVCREPKPTYYWRHRTRLTRWNDNIYSIHKQFVHAPTLGYWQWMSSTQSICVIIISVCVHDTRWVLSEKNIVNDDGTEHPRPLTSSSRKSCTCIHNSEMEKGERIRQFYLFK